MGGEGGGGDGGFAARQKKEEERKAGLRTKINHLYGLDSGAPTREQFTRPGEEGDVFDDNAYQKALAKYQAAGGDEAAVAARAQLAAEEAQIEQANRTFYGEDLKHSYDRAKRNNTFALADRGLLGGSAQVDTEAELNRDNTLGATRLEDEVRAAVAGLKNQREGERLNAMTLVNSGAGEDAVAGAQAGLSRALQNASATRKASIAGDLFTTGADSVAAGQDAGLGALAMQRYQNQLRTFFGNPNGGAGGRVTAT